MTIVKKEVRVCDACGSELQDYGIRTSSVPHEGCSEIAVSKTAVYGVRDADFCDMTCFLQDMCLEFEIDNPLHEGDIHE